MLGQRSSHSRLQTLYPINSKLLVYWCIEVSHYKLSTERVELLSKSLYILFIFHGRINRRQYWLGWLLFVVLMLPVAIWNGTFEPSSQGSLWFLVVFSLVFGIWCPLAISVKRLHDWNLSGWWTLLAFVPLVNAVFFFPRGHHKG